MEGCKLPTVAVIGAGSRGFVYAGCLKDDQALGRVVAVAEPRPFFREEFVRRHGVAPGNVFETWEDLLARPKLADAVIIATTDRMHHAPALAAAAKGYHILLEKPMAPTVGECIDIAGAVRDAGVMLVVGHVLRYTVFYGKIREILDSGALGEVCTIQHFEGVAWWHFAHSFVRGNFGNEARSSFSLLAKCCHDLDLLRWWADRKCLRVSSFGTLKHFRRESAPAGSAERCLDCPLADGVCPYSAKAFYFEKLRSGSFTWPLNMVIERPDEAELEAALRTGPYGRCVYRCDNDVADTQIVNCEFEDGVSAAMTMSAFTPHGRKVRIMGTHGYLEGEEKSIRVLNFRDGSWTETDVNKLATDITGGHGGGDKGIMQAFMGALATGDRSAVSTGPEISLESHLMVFAAEQSRREGRTVAMAELERPA